MKFSASTIFSCLIASTLSAPAAQPFAIITRDDNTMSWVGGSAGCFGTYGRIKSVSVTPGYKAVFFSEYACKGQVLTQGSGQATFQHALDTKSIFIIPN